MNNARQISELDIFFNLGIASFNGSSKMGSCAFALLRHKRLLDEANNVFLPVIVERKFIKRIFD